MKKRLVVMSVLFVLTMIVATQVAQAEERMLVNIPFEFIAGNVTLPAGEYRVQSLDRTSAVLLINCSDPHASVVLATNAAQAKEIQSTASLVFNKYGHRYFLSQVWTEGSIRGKQFLKSPREEEIAKVASLETKEKITLVAGLYPARP
jgi:hypothetical protein